MLGYGELQILEGFKNTIPNRLYWILFLIDNLRVAVETAKKVLTKRVDRQMSGQSSVTPFMKVNNEHKYSAVNSCKKGVTIDVMETIERNSNSINKLTSLVSKMNMKMDKCEMQYKPQVYQGRSRGQNRHRKDILETDHTVQIETNHIEAKEIIIETIDQIIEVDHKTTIDMTIGETTIDMIIGKIATDKMIDVTIIDKNI